MVTAQLLPTPPQGSAELSSGPGFAPAGQVQPPPGEEPRASPPGSAPSPGACRARRRRLPAALTDVGVAESVLRVDGDASTSLHHQVPQAPAAEEHGEEAQPRRHVASEVPSPHFCGAGGQPLAGSPDLDSLFLTARPPPLRLAGPGSAAFAQQDSASLRARQVRGSQQLRAPVRCRRAQNRAAPRRTGARSYSLDRALSGSGGAAAPDQWEPGITSSAGEASGPGRGRGRGFSAL